METGNRVLDALMITLPMMKKMLGLDAQICLCDTKKTLGVWYADSFRMDIKVGEYFDRNKPGHDKMLEAMETRRENRGILPEFVYGVPVNGILSPVFDDNTVVGVVSCAVSVKHQAELEKAAENLNVNLESVSESSEEIADVAMKIAEKMDQIKTYADAIFEQIESVTNVMQQIQNNSAHSNILALNAAIEAARAGDKGKGFNVVAGEMGKLARMSGESSKDIKEKISAVTENLQNINNQIKHVADISMTQAGNVQEITSALKEIGEDADRLKEAAKIMG